VKSYVQKHKWEITPQILMIQINENILSELRFASSSTIYINTVRNYLKELRYIYVKVKKKMYIDGHERKDVMAYQKIFLK